MLHDSAYHNGLQVVNGDINYQKKRFNQLKGAVNHNYTCTMRSKVNYAIQGVSVGGAFVLLKLETRD